LRRLVDAGRPGARLLYWNMLAPRSRPPSMAAQLVPLEDLAQRLHAKDKAFFYSRLVIEQVA
jgi:S-adenosylmethionine-diacylglycerol 3-amino-3-carboxypropyl transferase